MILRFVECPKCGHGYDIASESRCLKGLLGGDSQVARCALCENSFHFTLQGQAVGGADNAHPLVGRTVFYRLPFAEGRSSAKVLSSKACENLAGDKFAELTLDNGDVVVDSAVYFESEIA